MTQINLIKLSQRGLFSDLLTDVLRNGARALLAQAVEAEVTGLGALSPLTALRNPELRS